MIVLFSVCLLVIVLGLGDWRKEVYLELVSVWFVELVSLSSIDELLAYLVLYVWHGFLAYACPSSFSPFAFALMAWKT